MDAPPYFDDPGVEDFLRRALKEADYEGDNVFVGRLYKNKEDSLPPCNLSNANDAVHESFTNVNDVSEDLSPKAKRSSTADNESLISIFEPELAGSGLLQEVVESFLPKPSSHHASTFPKCNQPSVGVFPTMPETGFQTDLGLPNVHVEGNGFGEVKYHGELGWADHESGFDSATMQYNGNVGMLYQYCFHDY
ncbi:ethylene-responsive transcription factor ESR2-like [Capsella rubella]|uniref:ethylene-responsive transcription factor ESR2-like n=1 Tax=Capsella rubella TaxID=81985 RepID=UPI000CD4BC51|nr:ethylene-responsive transcription factor ESR2-like [Capsella rubella]